MAKYLHNPLPPAPAGFAVPSYQWGMLANDQYGCCTISGVVHLREAVAVDNLETETYPTDEQVIGTYLSLSGGQDTGLVEADVLHTWQTTGLFGDRIHGYAPVDHRNLDEIRSVCALFGGVYLGVAMPDSAQEQFEAGQPWDIQAGAQIEGGHAVPMIGYDPAFAYIVTWGKTQQVTWRWLRAYLEESWCVLLSESPAVDLPKLQADLTLIGQAA